MSAILAVVVSLMTTVHALSTSDHPFHFSVGDVMRVFTAEGVVVY